MTPNNESGGGPGQPRRAPVDFTIRFDPDRPHPFFAPSDWNEAAEELRHGNEKIVRFFEACGRGGYPIGVEPPVVGLSRPGSLERAEGG